MNRKVVRRFLEGKYLAIDEAENSLEAVKLFEKAYETNCP
jgi:CheY-like chemotaxis protein